MDYSARHFAARDHWRRGDYAEAERLAAPLWDEFPERRGFTWMVMAALQVAAGRVDEAASWVQRAHDEDQLWRVSLLDLPDLAPLRSHPRVAAAEKAQRALIAEIGARPLVLTEPARPDPEAPLLLVFHGANSTAAATLPHWLAAAGAGWTVACAQASQHTARDAFCWDPGPARDRDLDAIFEMLPRHRGAALGGFSQGAGVGLHWVLEHRLDAELLIACGASLPPLEFLPRSDTPVRVRVITGSEDPWLEATRKVVAGLAAQGHDATIEVIAGLGHEHPPDLGARLRDLDRRFAGEPGT